MLMLLRALIVVLLATASQAMAGEIVARSRTWAGSVTLESDGDVWLESCSLNLIAQFQQTTHRIGLKRPNSNCSLFGPVQLVLSETPDHREGLVIVEAARGGDGDHTGPLLEVFRIDKSAAQKIGEIELFSATYLRKGQEVRFIEGRRLFSLCTVCDGPEAPNPNDNIFVPVRVSVTQGALAVTPIVTLSERAAILRRFQQRRVVAEREYGLASQLAALEERLRALLLTK